MLTLRIPWTNQTLDKHVGDSTDSDNEEKEDGELEEGEVEEEFDENPQQKDDAKENNRDNNSTNESSIEPDNSMDVNNHSNLAAQKFRRRDYPPHLAPPRLNSTGGQQDKRNRHDLRRKRRHSGETHDDRNRKMYKRGRFRGNPLPDMAEDVEDDEMMGQVWPPRGPIRGQRKQQQSDMSNETAESTEMGDQKSSTNSKVDSKSEQSINSDETSSPTNDANDEENTNVDEKSDRNMRPRPTRNNQQQQQQQQQASIENRGRRYYEGNPNGNDNNNRRNNNRDRSSWQDRSGGGNNSNNNSNNNPRFRSDTGSSNNHGPPLCKFFLENRCAKGNDCLFSHDFKPPKKMEVCKYYVQNKGYCQKNEQCPFLHGEFPCKFYHTGQICTQGDRCKFSHDDIINEDIRFAFDRYLNDSDDMNRQNRANSSNNNNNNNNIQHPNNPPPVNFENMLSAAASLPLPPRISGALPDPANFSIPNLMDLLLLQNNSLKPVTEMPNPEATTGPVSNSQSSPPVQRPSLFTDTLTVEKPDNDESTINRTVSPANSTSPSSSTTENISTNPVSIASNTPVPTTSTTTTNAACPLPLPPASIPNQGLNLPSPFGRLPPPNLTRPPSSLLPPPPPGLFPMNTLGTGRVPILFPTNNGLPLPPPGSLLDVKLLAQAAALAAVNAAAANAAAAANKFPTPTHHHPQPSSPQLGRDIDERDRQSSTTMRGDIDERPSDVYNRPTPTTTPSNLGLLQTSTNLIPATSSSSSSASPPAVTINDEHPKPNSNIQDLFRTARPTTVETLSNPTSTSSTVGPSFDFISMLEQLKQPQQAQSNENSHDSLEIRSSSNPTSIYILRRVLLSFKPYQLPDKADDPRIAKYQEKMSQWSEQARLERFKTYIPSSNNYSLPLRTQQQTPPPPLSSSLPQSMINDTNSSRDPRLLRNSIPSSKMGVSILPPSNSFARPNDNIL